MTGLPCLVETHAHLDSPKYDGDRDQVIQRATDSGVDQIVTIGTDLASSRAAVRLAEEYDCVYATVGVHPHHATSMDPETVGALRRLAAHPKVVAVGETGLDFYRDYAPRAAQHAAFGEQLELAAAVRKPVVVHIRDVQGESGAYDAVLDALRLWVMRGRAAANRSPGVLHCFSGNIQVARIAVDLGFYLGVDGPVTYPNSEELRALVRELPLEQLLLETDCPYLTPQPRRGKRNEPSYLFHIAHKMAELHGVSVEHVAHVTSGSARRLFGLAEA